MNNLQYLIGPLIVVLIFSAIFLSSYKDFDVKKSDKGFVIKYRKLTRRRKFVRSLWSIPILCLYFLYIDWFSYLTSLEYKLIGIVIIVGVSLDIAYNYVKWKKNEQEFSEDEIDKKIDTSKK